MALVWHGGRAVLMAGLMAGMAAQAARSEPVPPPGGTGAPMSLAALNQLEAGLWQLDVKGRSPRQICVADPISLVQVEHEQLGCSRFVIANDPKSSTVHYSCQGAGWGRTTVRVETPRTAVIQTQGISRNAPFDYTVEARRIGPCGAQSAARQR
ncbi:hypothetical protein ASD39_03245 [Sphingomonas sp. Root50]|nr:hypothetical protein ASD17_02040 [Sphingomonas sp. Root1294]KQY69447.1 hypothetical protein ASD39_03245 [Sphingomonas sp. Root50]KRB89854.1 hypothetical protein ASE22_18160 [Sphingomonas sp. Root720]